MSFTDPTGKNYPYTVEHGDFGNGEEIKSLLPIYYLQGKLFRRFRRKQESAITMFD